MSGSPAFRKRGFRWLVAATTLAFATSGPLVFAPSADAAESYCNELVAAVSKNTSTNKMDAGGHVYCQRFYWARLTVKLWRNGEWIASRTKTIDNSTWTHQADLYAHAYGYDSWGKQKWQASATVTARLVTGTIKRTDWSGTLYI